MSEIDVKKLRERVRDCTKEIDAADRHALVAALDRLEAAEKAIREIAEQDPVEMALDPTWAKRIASAALAQRQGERS
ncbi:hypothetical protein [Burkholderia territorii]|uniref:hypothetical protein n=1 Tax=Burkholderia territorii TaxID=1503055 RepID=UPI0007560363|nr:hypothetical protein [Burkholderia territorii]KWO62598.1 hypothetical protein WT98_30495 [Burkholderia territorii]